MKENIKKMKEVFNKILDSKYFIHMIVLASVLLLLGYMGIQNSLDWPEIIKVLIIIAIIILYIVRGLTIIKTIATTLIILGLISIYSSITFELHGIITQPFLLSVASITTFLAQTYRENSYNFGLRSRRLSSLLLAVTLVFIKLELIVLGFDFWIAETAGMFYILIYVIVWNLFIIKSKKTKINTPDIIEEKTIDNFKVVYLNNKLDITNKTWNNNSDDNLNAYPYIYNEAMKLYENDLYLVLISKKDESELYDVEEITINKNKTIPFLYMEDKDGVNEKTTLLKFQDEIKTQTQTQ